MALLKPAGCSQHSGRLVCSDWSEPKCPLLVWTLWGTLSLPTVLFVLSFWSFTSFGSGSPHHPYHHQGTGWQSSTHCLSPLQPPAPFPSILPAFGGISRLFLLWNFIVYYLSLYFDSSHRVHSSTAILPGHLQRLFLTWCLPSQTTHLQKAQSVTGCSTMGSCLGFSGIYFAASWGRDVSSEISKNNCCFLPCFISTSSVSLGRVFLVEHRMTKVLQTKCWPILSGGTGA